MFSIPLPPRCSTTSVEYTGKIRDDLDVVVAPRTDLRKIILEFHGFRSSIKAADKKITSESTSRNWATANVWPR